MHQHVQSSSVPDNVSTVLFTYASEHHIPIINSSAAQPIAEPYHARSCDCLSGLEVICVVHVQVADNISSILTTDKSGLSPDQLSEQFLEAFNIVAFQHAHVLQNVSVVSCTLAEDSVSPVSPSAPVKHAALAAQMTCNLFTPCLTGTCIASAWFRTGIPHF